jgi:hypothetical protein
LPLNRREGQIFGVRFFVFRTKMLGANKQQQPQQQAFNSTSSTTEDTNSFTTLTTTATVIHSHPSNTTAQSRSSPGKQPHQQRKRQSLRERFITLRQIVPDLQASTGSKTEAVILQKGTLLQLMVSCNF